jgi:hypothetical protein
MNSSRAENTVQWLFLDLNAFFASCDVIPVQANHRLYTDYHEQILEPSTPACRSRRSARSMKWRAVS